MNPFSYQQLSSLNELSSESAANVEFYAGGTDLLPLMKAGLCTPDSLMDIKAANLSSAIEQTEHGLGIGALTTLADIEQYEFAPRYALLQEAAAQAASPQLRNRATIAGNILQRPRCWYYRNSSIDCWLKGGSDCPAHDGRNEHHALFGAPQCIAVHPSDLASCLSVLDATIELTAAEGQRSISIHEFHAMPDDHRRKENTLASNELITGITISSAEGGDTGKKSCYLKVMDRKVWAFALAGLAATWRLDSSNRIDSISLALSGVSPVPRRLSLAEQELVGKEISPAVFRKAAELALQKARPLQHNAYKMELVRRLMQELCERMSQD